MSVDQTLDFFNRVYNEDINQVLSGSIQPVVEWSGAFGKLQVKDIDLFHDAFSIIQSLPSSLG